LGSSTREVTRTVFESICRVLPIARQRTFGATLIKRTSAAFVDFLGDIVASQPKRREIP
jgi:hypothetical protein